MAARSVVPVRTVDDLLRSMLIIARTLDYVLDTCAVELVTEEPLSGSKVQILRLLGTNGPQTSSQIARFLSVSKPAVTQLIDTMVRSKLVSRKTATEDRREVRVSLAAKGQKVFESIRDQQRQIIRAALRDSKQSPTQWLETLEDIIASTTEGECDFHEYCLQCPSLGEEGCVLIGGGDECAFLEHMGGGRKAKGDAARSKARSKAKSKVTRSTKKRRRAKA